MNAATTSLRRLVRHYLRPTRGSRPRLLAGPPQPDPRLPVVATDPNALFPG